MALRSSFFLHTSWKGLGGGGGEIKKKKKQKEEALGPSEMSAPPQHHGAHAKRLRLIRLFSLPAAPLDLAPFLHGLTLEAEWEAPGEEEQGPCHLSRSPADLVLFVKRAACRESKDALRAHRRT